MTETATDSAASLLDGRVRNHWHQARQTVRLLALVRPYLGRFIIATVFLILGSAISLAYPQAVRVALDEGLGDRASTEVLDQIGVALMVLFAAQAAFTWCRHYLMAWLGERAVVDLRVRVAEHLLRLSPGWFHQRRTGELVGPHRWRRRNAGRLRR